MREVTGDFVLTLDADDLILPTYLEDAIAALAEGIDVERRPDVTTT